MKKPLVDILLSSEKRKNVLLLLKDGTKDMDFLLESLDTPRTSLLPQMKKLLENHLVEKSDDSYELTTIGEIIVEEMEVFLYTVKAFDDARDYLGTHNIDFIPRILLQKLPWIGTCEIEEAPIVEFYDVDKEFFNIPMKSKYWFHITSTLHPSFHNFYAKMTDYVTDVSVIITEKVFQKMKADYYYELKDLIDLDLISFYIYPDDLEFQSFILADNCINFKLLTKKGYLDNKKIIYCSPEAILWGKQFFEHYKQMSTPLLDV